MDMNSVYTPATLTEIIRRTFENSFPYVWIKGEISSFTRAASGHIYFTLKDSLAQIQCVWFLGRQPKGTQTFDPLTGEVYVTPQPSPADILGNGLEVICSGSVTIYGARSQYQLNVEMIRPAGAGLLALEFEARKAKYAQAGYFNEERKKSLPQEPLRIAVIASPGGAAIHDFLKIANLRGTGSIIRLYPAPAQGTDAAERMAAMIRLINEQGWAELIVLVRGGGSAEDLWAFNEDILIESIYASGLPVLAGIGHEIDITIADMVADVRAATPTHAAQLLWPLRSELWQRLDNLQLLLEKQITQCMILKNDHWERIEAALKWVSPIHKLSQNVQTLENFWKRLEYWRIHWLSRLQDMLNHLQYQLWHVKGFSDRLNFHSQHVIWLDAELNRNIKLFMNNLGNELDRQCLSLSSHDPAAPLKRGYAILTGKKGMLKSVTQINKDEELKAWLYDGIVKLTVDSITQTSLINGEEIFACLKEDENAVKK